MMTYLFSDFELHPERRTLTRRGKAVHVEPRVFDLMTDLIEHRDQVVSKEELIERVWEGAFVSDAALKRAVQEARRALGDDGERQEIIQTAYGRGYRFIVKIDSHRPRQGVSPLSTLHGYLVISTLVSGLFIAFWSYHMTEAKTKPKPKDEIHSYAAYMKGRAAIQTWEPESLNLAIEMFERAVRIKPTFVEAHAYLAKAHILLYYTRQDRTPSRLSRAHQALIRASELDPKSPEVLRARGYYHYWGLGDYEGAVDELAKVAESLPNDVELLADLAYLQRRLGHFKEAVQNLQKVLAHEPENASIAYDLGLTHSIQRNFQQADHFYSLAIALNPASMTSYGFKSINHLLWNGDIQAARSTLDDMPDLDPNLSIWFRWWQLLFERNFPAILQQLSTSPVEVVDLPMDFLPVVLLRARCWSLIGELGKAREAYAASYRILEKEVEQRPEDPRIQASLSVALAGLGRRAEALRVGRLSVKLLPQAQDPVWGTYQSLKLADIYAMLGETELAITELEILLSIPSYVSRASLHLDPRWDSLRGHPRFKALDSRVGAFATDLGWVRPSGEHLNQTRYAPSHP